MLDAFRYLLCSKLCWHNRPEPNDRDKHLCTCHHCCHRGCDTVASNNSDDDNNYYDYK